MRYVSGSIAENIPRRDFCRRFSTPVLFGEIYGRPSAGRGDTVLAKTTSAPQSKTGAGDLYRGRYFIVWDTFLTVSAMT